MLAVMNDLLRCQCMEWFHTVWYGMLWHSALSIPEPCCQQRYYQARELMSLDRVEKVKDCHFPNCDNKFRALSNMAILMFNYDKILSIQKYWIFKHNQHRFRIRLRSQSSSGQGRWAGSKNACGTCLRSRTRPWAPG